MIAVLEDGQELIECIEKESPDIVITDIQMPEVNGLDVCKYLYETRPETQVIILTAYSNLIMQNLQSNTVHVNMF